MINSAFNNENTMENSTEISTLFCENLTASYGNSLILKDISFQVRQGDFICLCGPNGTGKTTLLEILSGIQEDNLKISAKEMPCIKSENSKNYISKLPRKELAKKIAIMQQKEFSMWNFSVSDLVLQGRFPYSNNGFYKTSDEQLVQQTLKELNLEQLAQKSCHEISGGEFQKVMIARALVQEPKFLFMDEPTSNLDFVYEQSFLQLLKNLAKEKNIGITLTLHNLNLASTYADFIALLPPKKNLIMGKPEEVLNEENLYLTYSQNIKLFNHPVTGKKQVYV